MVNSHNTQKDLFSRIINQKKSLSTDFYALKLK